MSLWVSAWTRQWQAVANGGSHVLDLAGYGELILIWPSHTHISFFSRSSVYAADLGTVQTTFEILSLLLLHQHALEVCE